MGKKTVIGLGNMTIECRNCFGIGHVVVKEKDDLIRSEIAVDLPDNPVGKVINKRKKKEV